MTPNLRALGIGALSGFFSAVLTDLHAWSLSGSGFEWKLALKRWLVGAVSGALAAAGVAQS